MVLKILGYQPVQFLLSTLIILGAVICIFTPNYFLFKLGASYAVHLMFGYLFIGILFLMLKQSNLMFTSFACCAGLCIFLKSSANPELILPAKTNEESVKVAHFNISTFGDDYDQILNTILKTDADVVSIQEITPDWNDFIKNSLIKKQYPHDVSLVRIDPFGLAVYSKYEFTSVDTFYYNNNPNFRNIPNLHCVINSPREKRKVNFISSRTYPPFNSTAYQHLRDHMVFIAKKISTITGPVITFGDYNAVPWSKEVIEFKDLAQLNDSRRSHTPSFKEGSFMLFHLPIDHIFFSDQLRCVEFNNLHTPGSNHIGIDGTYQFNTNTRDVQATLQ